MFGIVESKTWFGDTKYEVVKSKTGLGGMGCITIAMFTDKYEAERYKEEQEYIAEQKRLEYEKNSPKKEYPNGGSREWDTHVADCYNDWNVTHGYRY